MKPLIIISPSINESEDEIKLSRACFDAVSAAGGFGAAVNYTDIDEIIETADGILLSGGGDIEPSLTGDMPDNIHSGFVCLSRDKFELELVKRAAERKIPVLGICRGMQIIGAAYGHHIIQHFDRHKQTEEKHQTSHCVKIERDSLLYSITKSDRLAVNSFHHQAVAYGDGLKISAVSDDGFIEAVEGTEENFLLGVQWHPEYLCENEKQMNIFKAFTEAAGRYRKCCGRYCSASL